MTDTTTASAQAVEENAAAAAETVAADADSPEALPGFDELGLSDNVLAAVADLGYEAPSPVQARAIPEVLAGRDVLAAAQTGTGKTAAFLLPTLSRLPHAGKGRGPLMLALTPTRELAQQIEEVCETVAKRTGHRSVTVVGGVGYEPQKRALRRGCDVLVATPGRLQDLIDQGEAHLGEVQTLVLDEADRMLDMGFLPAMRKIVAETPETRQTLLFSATLDEGQIDGIRDLVHEPAIVEIAHKGTVAETIDQYVLPVSLEAKNALLAKVLKAEGPSHVIVFTRTKHRADACCKRLSRAGISCAPIHGNRNQNQRERALRAFREGRTDVLVATDVLARGIDVSDVRYVVNFDVPEDSEDYIHRIGRTGRAGETGWSLTFVTTDDYPDLRDCERLMGKIVPTYERASEFDLGTEPPHSTPTARPRRARAARARSAAATARARRRSRARSATARAAAPGAATVASRPERRRRAATASPASPAARSNGRRQSSPTPSCTKLSARSARAAASALTRVPASAGVTAAATPSARATSKATAAHGARASSRARARATTASATGAARARRASSAPIAATPATGLAVARASPPAPRAAVPETAGEGPTASIRARMAACARQPRACGLFVTRASARPREELDDSPSHHR